MKRFKFNLEKVLMYKRLREDILKRELAELQRRLEEERRRLLKLETKQREHLKELGAKVEGKVELREVLLYQEFIAGLGEDIEGQIDRIEELLAKLEDKRDELVGSSKEKRVLENLRQRRYDEYIYAADRLESKFLDEIGNGMEYRKKHKLN